MSDIFLSYSSEDRSQAKIIAHALEGEGWSVWWDRAIPTGQNYYRVIQAELDRARCVVVVWSRRSVVSDWVPAEAQEGLKRGILIPVAIESCSPPLIFRQLQTADLSDWDGDSSSPAFRRIVNDLAAVIGSPAVVPSAVRSSAPHRPPRRAFLVAVALFVACIAAGLLWRYLKARPPRATNQNVSEISDERSTIRKDTQVEPVFELWRGFELGHKMGRVNYIAWSRDGRLVLFCVNYAGETPWLWDATAWKALRRFTEVGNPDCAAFSPSGARIAFGDRFGVSVFHTESAKPVMDKRIDSEPCSALWFQGEDSLVGHFGSGLYRSTVPHGRLERLFSHPGLISVTPETNLIAVQANDGSRIDIEERLSKTIQAKLPARVGFRNMWPMIGGAFSEDGKWFASSDKELVRIWDISSSRQSVESKAILSIPDTGQNLVFSPDSKLLSVAGHHGTIRLWEAKSGKLRQTITEKEFVESFAFRSDWRFLVSAHDGGKIRVWRAL